jgi:lipid-binding SYLF domain-containing protein
MARLRCSVLFFVLVAAYICSPQVAAADSYSSAIQLFRNYPEVQPFFADAYGYAIFPNVGKGGFWIGAAYGKGRVYRGDEFTGTARVYKGSFGLQLGGQVFSEIVFFQDQRAYTEFTSGSFEFDASASVVAITAGAQARAGTEGLTAGVSAGPATGKQAKTDYTKGMAVFVHTKGGLMYEAVVGGQKFTYEPF